MSGQGEDVYVDVEGEENLEEHAAALRRRLYDDDDTGPVVYPPSARALMITANRLYYEERYTEAIKFYNCAIIGSPHLIEYRVARIKCFLKLNQWDEATLDCRHILDKNPFNVHGCYFLGMSFMGMEKFNEAIHHLKSAHTLAKHIKLNFEDTITEKIRKALKLKWKKEEDSRKNKEIELLSYLKKLMEEDMARKINAIQSPSSKAQVEEVENRTMEIRNQTDKYTAELQTIFVNNHDNFKKRELPEYLCGFVGYGIVKDPVITPSGISYDRNDIVEHIKNFGQVDPIAGYKLTVDQLIPNLALKELAEAFIEENEWVKNYCTKT